MQEFFCMADIPARRDAMSNKNKVSTKKQMAIPELVTFLENITAGMHSGNVVVECGSDAIVMRVPGEVKVELEARQKNEKNKIILGITWENGVSRDEEILKIRAGGK